MNPTIASLTASSLLGKRRVLLLFVLPVLLVALAVVIRMTAGSSLAMNQTMLETFVMTPMVPLLGLIIGVGVIAPEIDDGSILYILAKPVPRSSVVITKLAMAIGGVVAFVAVPTLLAGLIVGGVREGVTPGFVVAALIGGVAYAALFLWLGVISRHAMVIGLVYALMWESLVGAYVPGAQVISIQQWSLAIGGEIAVEGEIESAVSLGVGATLLAIVVVGATALAISKLRSLTLTEAE